MRIFCPAMVACRPVSLVPLVLVILDPPRTPVPAVGCVALDAQTGAMPSIAEGCLDTVWLKADRRYRTGNPSHSPRSPILPSNRSMVRDAWLPTKTGSVSHEDPADAAKRRRDP